MSQDHTQHTGAHVFLAEPHAAPPRSHVRLIAILILLWSMALLKTPWRAWFPLVAAAPPPAVSTINPNTAPWWELTLLPQIGPATADSIIDYRRARRNPDEAPVFTTAEDLRNVRGIGPKTVERIRPWLRFDP